MVRRVTRTAAIAGRRLHEIIFDLVQQTLFARLVVGWQCLPQLLEQLALLAAKLCGNSYVDVHVKIAPSVALEMWNSEPLQLDLGAFLRAFRNLHILDAIEGENIHFGPE